MLFGFRNVVTNTKLSTTADNFMEEVNTYVKLFNCTVNADEFTASIFLKPSYMFGYTIYTGWHTAAS